MKLLAVVILCCLSFVGVMTERTWADYLLQQQKLEIEQQQLQLDILKYINAQNDKLEQKHAPAPQKPSLELKNLRG